MYQQHSLVSRHIRNPTNAKNEDDIMIKKMNSITRHYNNRGLTQQKESDLLLQD